MSRPAFPRRDQSTGAGAPMQQPGALPPKSQSRSRERIDKYRQRYITPDDASPMPSRRPSNAEDIPLHPRVEDAMAEIRTNWPFMLQDDFQDVPVAMQLLESPGARSVRAFDDVLGRLEPSIDTIVDDYHHSFNFSIQYYSETVEGMNDVQRRLQSMKAMLLQSRDHLQLKEFDLMGLWNKSLVYKEMLRIMDVIEEMRNAPGQIEQLVAGKYYYSAVKTLNNATKTINGPECRRIGALDDVRKQLGLFKESIFESIVNDLSNHVYLKSPYAEDRWTNYAAANGIAYTTSAARASSISTSTLGPAAAIGAGGRRRSMVPPTSAGGPRSSISDSLRDLVATRSPVNGTSLNRTAPWADNAITLDGGGGASSDVDVGGGDDDDDGVLAHEHPDEHPEADSVGFMTLCLEALVALGQLADGLAAVHQRVPRELFELVDKCLEEASDRAKAAAMTAPAISTAEPVPRPTGARGMVDAHALRDTRAKEARFAALRELTATLCAKLEAVVEGHKLICNLVDAMSRRTAFERAGNRVDALPVYTVEDIAEAVHEEIEHIMVDNIQSRGSTTDLLITDLLPPSAEPGTSRPGGSPALAATVFKFDRSDAYASVSKFYKAQLSNAVSNAAGLAAARTTNAPMAGQEPASIQSHVPDKYALAQRRRHKTLFAEPDAEYITVIYRPVMDFMTRLVSLANCESGSRYGQFLDDFLLATYIPSIEAKVQTYVHKYINGPDGFVVGDDQLLQSATSLLSLIQSLCATMWHVPFHKQEYLRMIEDVLSKYLEKCFAKYKTCVSTVADGHVQECVSGVWAQHPDLVHIVTQNTLFRDDVEPNYEMNERFNVQEILLEARLCDDRSFQRSELIFDPKRLELMAALRESLKWFRQEMVKLMETRVEDALLLMSDPVLSASQGDLSMSQEFRESGAVGGDLERSNTMGSRSRMLAPAPSSPISAPSLLAAANGTNPRPRSTSPLDSDDGPAVSGSAQWMMLAVPHVQTARFHELLDAYQALTDTCVVTLHLELRVHAMYFADLAMREGTYYIEDPNSAANDLPLGSPAPATSGDDTMDPEPYMLQLNGDLSVFEALCERTLSRRDGEFIFDGVALLLTHYLVANVRYLRRLNVAGVYRMVQSIRALHQHLLHTTLCHEIRLDHARRYYELFLLGADRMIEDIADHGATYTLDEYKNMLDLMFDVAAIPDKLASEDPAIASAAARAERAHRELVQRLSEWMRVAG
ncbi:hypothetical protein AMAG_11553 [Allomyces macrogynus ATCC 38327]|uniref:Exocyst complex component Sec8 n=1 Tax=Allomyces macrogynus (strain ATCC 38327) TaxID=578462 RepID=A0A0L0SV08_ALLM3|nr:hypothetical protein AMAG_11553 [Allomyces macrogynus ATCC 38327]|eukprot:KNE66413.1 hypothetical protein AMAG_11553 [Allomyces macrogynus ATCC 38327]